MDILEQEKSDLQKLSLEELENLRKVCDDKASLFNIQQLAEKTMINSLYGALGNKYFPLFNEEIAKAITGNGRYFIKKLAENIENGLQSLIKSDKNYMVASDTDSCYFHIEPFVEKFKQKYNKNEADHMQAIVDFCDKFEKKIIKKIIEDTIKEFTNDFNAFNEEVIGVGREIISDRAVFVAKKKYFARVRDLEGVRYSNDNPYIKKMGLELIKSSTPVWVKQKLNEAIPIILDSTEKELKAWLKQIKTEYLDQDLSDICFVGGTSSLNYSLDQKGVPIGVRASLIYNDYVLKNKLDDKYGLITSGEKTKRLFLIAPNKFNSNIIAFSSDSFANEIDCVDYDMTFEKTFSSPLRIMIDCLGYNLDKKTETLEMW